MADSGPKSGVKGILNDLKGKVKEAAGTLSGKESLEQEGAAQQERAEAEREVAKREGQADAARAEAKSAEAEQRGHERAK